MAPASVPSVSIVVLNHNYERYVGGALASAVGQEPGDFRVAEVVVIDDGSTDRSHDVYTRWPSVHIVRQAHAGFAVTLTRAVEETCGDWFAPLDADDAFTTDKLRILAPYLADPELLIIQHAEYVIDADGQPFAEGIHPGGSTSTLLVRAEAARDLLPVTNELFFQVLADLGFGTRLAEPLTCYRVHGASMTDRRTPGVFADYMAGVCLDIGARLDQLGSAPTAWATPQRLADLAAAYRDRAAEHRDEARRQRDRAALVSPEGRSA